jgi:hypothetical protein
MYPIPSQSAVALRSNSMFAPYFGLITYLPKIECNANLMAMNYKLKTGGPTLDANEDNEFGPPEMNRCYGFMNNIAQQII